MPWHVRQVTVRTDFTSEDQSHNTASTRPAERYDFCKRKKTPRGVYCVAGAFSAAKRKLRGDTRKKEAHLARDWT